MLKNLWDGSPATVTIQNAANTLEEIEYENISDLENESGEEDNEDDHADLDMEPQTVQKNVRQAINHTQKFVDNKRKNMEKSLSASQRDQV